jgi:hypothetical protein
MKPIIHLALTHDWELRGDGSGDIEQIQFAPLRRLLKIYRQAGVRTTFLPDVMQQIRFREVEKEHPELKSLADSWDEHVRQTLQQGHDIQLHLHPQWLNGRYFDGRWRLEGDWSIVNYLRADAHAMLEQARTYLETLLQPIAADYRCVAFRAGALAAAPSDHLFESLIDLKILLDVSVAPGLLVNDRNVQLDYRNCEESFLPFYPLMKDARFVSPIPQPIVCVPLNYFYGSRRSVTKQNISLLRKQISKRKSVETKTATLASSFDGSRFALAFEKLVRPAINRKYFVSDTGRLSYRLMKEMLASIRRRVRESGLTNVPVVLTNHPKDIRDWAGLERFIGEVSQASDIEFITLAEIAQKIETGEFSVHVKAS